MNSNEQHGYNKNRIDMLNLKSFTYNCPVCGKSVTITGPREMLDKTEKECSNCRMEKDGTMEKIKNQRKQNGN